MLGRTAGGLYWMFRYLERSENIAWLLEAGMRIALTNSSDLFDEWDSVLLTAGQQRAYVERYDDVEPAAVIDFLLRDRHNPSSVRSVVELARSNAREVRTALTREVWEATNATWLAVTDALRRPVSTRDLPRVRSLIRQESAYVRGALHGTMLRNDIYNFSRLGTFLERADNTARILDVKYYVLLPSPLDVGGQLDNAQWETILRSVSAQRAFRWRNGGNVTASGIADFLILDRQMPRSLLFCYERIDRNLEHLAADYAQQHQSHELSRNLRLRLAGRSIDDIIELGLHEFLSECIRAGNELGISVEHDYRFNC